MATDLRFYAPPFAVAFDEDGKLLSRAHTDGSVSNFGIDGTVYYDADGDTQFRTSNGGNGPRPSPYDPEAWDARVENVATVGTTDASGDDRRRYELPFERIETVNAIVVFDQLAFEQITGGWSAATDAQKYDFFTQNNEQAKILFFSPTTGTVIRN